MASKEHEALVEKVARAMADADPQQCGNVNESEMGDYFWEQWREYYIPQAQAAISTVLAALQEPTQPMVRSVKHDLAWYHAAETWRAMLNASPLGEQSE